MLVLRRKLDEALVIDGTITVTVLGIEGGRVKVGIEAPPGISVVRGELLDAEQQRAHLRRKQEALEEVSDPRQRERLAQGIARLQRSLALAPASLEARQD